MKIFIIGIAGQTGFRLARQLRKRGEEVDGLYRRPAQREALGTIGVTGTLGDLVQIDARQLADDIKGNDVIVFTAGAGGSDSDAMIDAIDGDGVTKSITAAQLAGIKRFVLVSVFPEAGRGEDWGESFEHYMRAKKQADVTLAQADLDWVILRPSTLTDLPGVGTVSLGPAQLHTEVSRDDVAATIVELIDTPTIRRTILELTGGTTPIECAVAIQARS
ncbi:NAD(P)H-binding protein [Bradyrhizobium sp.]|uniref:NAD(P)H-binding protein n=1 Tax=Bradyrhizobium sp. TaxID=376 RepID=UPI003C38AF02